MASKRIPPDAVFVCGGNTYTPAEYAALSNIMRARTPRSTPPPAQTASVPDQTVAAIEAERQRIAAILSLPAAKRDRAGAEALAFASTVTPAEAAGALARTADARRAAGRQIAADDMRGRLGMATTTLRPGQINGLRHTARHGTPAEREAAKARLAAAGVPLNP